MAEPQKYDPEMYPQSEVTLYIQQRTPGDGLQPPVTGAPIPEQKPITINRTEGRISNGISR
jgi:hypothetical protein